MELLTPLMEYIRIWPSKREIIRLGIDICKALELCSQYNMIHHDVKPSNIFATDFGGYKLGDLGAATNTVLGSNTAQLGTLRYMAPEVYLGKPYSSNIDTYSLGLVLYELLNGNRIPLLSASKRIPDLKSKNKAFERRMAGESLPRIPNAGFRLSSIILKACAYNPKERFSSPSEMRKALEKLQ